MSASLINVTSAETRLRSSVVRVEFDFSVSLKNNKHLVEHLPCDDNVSVMRVEFDLSASKNRRAPPSNLSQWRTHSLYLLISKFKSSSLIVVDNTIGIPLCVESMSWVTV